MVCSTLETGEEVVCSAPEIRGGVVCSTIEECSATSKEICPTSAVMRDHAPEMGGMGDCSSVEEKEEELCLTPTERGVVCSATALWGGEVEGPGGEGNAVCLDRSREEHFWTIFRKKKPTIREDPVRKKVAAKREEKKG